MVDYDFATQVYIGIAYKRPGEDKTSFIQEEDGEERRYNCRFKEVDLDFEELPDYYGECMKEKKRRVDAYGERVLFMNGKWLCLEHGKYRVLKILKANGIEEAHLVKVFKRLRGRAP